MKILIIHGPNMNLLGLKSARQGTNVTLDKVNRHIRRFVRDKDIELKIVQSHNENKIVSYLHRNRNKFDGAILTPGVWTNIGHLLEETLSLINLELISIYFDKTSVGKLLNGSYTVIQSDYYRAFEEAILQLKNEQ